MSLRPPQHRIDAPGVYVHAAESAWDEERIIREQTEMEERGDSASDHPVARYLGGWTRYDLDASETLGDQVVTVREYLDMAKSPAMWKLQRLSVTDHYDVQGLWEQEVRSGTRPFKAYLRACAVGLLGVENGPELAGAGKGKTLTISDLDKLHTLSPQAPELPIDIGMAIHNFSASLRDDEKKA